MELMMHETVNGLTAVFLFFVLFCANSTLFAAGAEVSEAHAEKPRIALELGFKAGYRSDQLNWNIARDFTGSQPNVLSELSWDDLEIYQVQFQPSLSVAGKMKSGFRYHLRGLFGWGDIFDGDNQDSDYAGDNRTLEFSRSNNAADGGDVQDFSVGAGLEFFGRGEVWTFIPLLGYSYHEQNLQITDGYQTVSEQALADGFFGTGRINLPPLGPIVGLDSRYHSEWYGPWLGLELIFASAEKWNITGTVEYHLIEYYGEADWNLREDLQHPASFRHWAEGEGFSFTMGLLRNFNRSWSGTLNVNFQKWHTDDGTDVTYLANGSTSGTLLNEVNWESFSLLAGVTRRF